MRPSSIRVQRVQEHQNRSSYEELAAVYSTKHQNEPKYHDAISKGAMVQSHISKGAMLDTMAPLVKAPWYKAWLFY